MAGLVLCLLGADTLQAASGNIFLRVRKKCQVRVTPAYLLADFML